jgi:hypothetical protein
LQVPQQSLAAYTGRAEPYRQTWGRVASNTKSRILNPKSQSALPADCAVPALAWHAISAPPLTCDTLLAVHLLLPATAISFNSLALISCIAPLIAQAQDPEVFNKVHGLATHPPPGTCLICQTVPSSVTAELQRSQAFETNIRLCCDRRLILLAKAL